MARDNESTTKFKADISELKSAFQEAQRAVKIANSEFKAATAGMDDWGNSADGLSAKITQLNKVLSSEEKKLDSLKKQYELVAKEQGENSKGAQELLIKINNQQAAVAKTTKELANYQDKLENIEDESEKTGKESGSLRDELTDTGNAAESAGGGFTIMKGALSDLVSKGISLAVDKIKDLVGELISAEDAYKSFQTQTGKSAVEMEQFTGEINELYKNNYGESLEDISDSMAKVAQNTKETDPSKIGELTENALALRDTFGYDVAESMRAVNMLMDQFGISGEEAFNLVVQGAQKGLDKNGDMLDSINEYSVHYQQMGYTAEEFFNSLANGTDAGTFSVDKLGDAMKEFGIRTKDTAESTTEGFELVGLSADEMRSAFANGGTVAQKATEKTLKALFEMDDEVKQNQAGVDLFGTMWEDLGKDGVKALMDTQGEISKTKDAMEEVKEVKYDSVKNDISSIGRKFQTDILMPIIEKAMPKIRKGLDWVIDHLDSLTVSIEGMAAVIGTAWAAIKVVQNPVMAGITALAAGLGLLVAHIVTAKDSTNDLAESYAKLTPEQQLQIDKAHELSDSYNKLSETKQANIANVNAEFDYYEKLWDELQTIVDENGKVKEGYEDRASVITGILSDALGTEITMTDGVIDKYGDLKKSIDDVIDSKKAEAILSANEEAYAEAVKKQTEAQAAMADAWQTYSEKRKELEEAKQELTRLELIPEDVVPPNYQEDMEKAIAKVDGLTTATAQAADAWQQSKGACQGYNETIRNYEGVSAAIVSGDTEQINIALLKMQNGFLTAEDANKSSLMRQNAQYKEQLEAMKQAVADGMPGVTQEQVTQFEKLVELSDAELKKLEPKVNERGKNSTAGFANGAESQRSKVKNEFESLSNEGDEALGSADTGATGVEKTVGFADGARSSSDEVNAACTEVAAKGKEGLESVDTSESGSNFIAGFVNSISSGIDWAVDTVRSLGNSVLSALGITLDEHSPSKETAKLGEFFTLGFMNGINDKKSALISDIQKMAREAVAALDSDLIFQANARANGSPFVNGTAYSGQGVTYNFYQTNNSPMALNNIEIYRQTRNLLSLRGGRRRV